MFFSGISDEAGASIEQQIAAHRELGWAQIELRLIDGVNLTAVDDNVFDKVYDQVTAAGLQVCCFASTLANWSRPVRGDFALDADELKRAIPRMHRFGTRFIRTMSWVQGEAPDEEWGDEAVRRYKILGQMAEDGGIVLLHENCTGWGGQSPEHSLTFLERVNSPAVKLMFDIGNCVGHGQDSVDYLTKVIEHVLHVHVKDGGVTAEGKHTYFYPGEGASKVAECFAILRAYGYDAGYSIEPHLAAIVHTGEVGGAEREQALWSSYLEYGRRMMAIYDKVAGAAAR